MGKSKGDKKTSSRTKDSSVTVTKGSKLSSSILATAPCSTLTNPNHVSYFTALCDRLGNTVSVEATSDKGKGLFARTAVEEGNILFFETPLGTLQHSANIVPLCEYCKRFIGTLEDQLVPLLNVKLNSAQRASLDKDTARDLENSFRLDGNDPSSSASTSDGNSNLAASSSSAVSASSTINDIHVKKFKLPVVDDTYLTDIVPCRAGCGDRYCSEGCRDMAWRKYHAILCTGPVEDDDDDEENHDETEGSSNIHHHHHHHHHQRHHHHDEHCNHDHTSDNDANDEDGGHDEDEGHDDHDDNEGDDDEHTTTNLNVAALFRQQALATNEIFLLAGRMICRILETWVRNGNDMEKALIPFKVLHAEPWTQIFAKQQKGIKGLNLSTTKTNTTTTEEEYDEEQYILETQQQILEWVRDSATILRQLIEQRLPAYVELIENTISTPMNNHGTSGSTNISNVTASTSVNPTTSTSTTTTPDSSSSSSNVSSSSSSSSSTSTTTSTTSPTTVPKKSRTELTPQEIYLLFDADNYELLIGAFELNNIEMKIDSPLRDYMSIIASLPKTVPDNQDGTTLSPYHQAVSVLSPYLRRIVAADKARKQLAKAVRAFTGEDGDLDDDDEEEGDDDEENLDEDEAGTSANPGAKHKHHHHGEDDHDEENDSDYVPSDNDDDDDDADDDDNDDDGDDGDDDDDEITYIDLPDDQYGGPLRVPLRLFPIASGTGLFAIQCCANHSCDPNVQLCYIQGNCTGAFMALEDIKAGEELFINYVDIENDVKERQDELAHYGFLCQCPRCKEEIRSKKLSLKKWSKTL